MSALGDSRLVIINTETNSDGIIFIPTKETVSVGTDINCDIRINHNDILRKHFEIYYSDGKVKVKKFASLSSFVYRFFVVAFLGIL
jgi:FHA domain